MADNNCSLHRSEVEAVRKLHCLIGFLSEFPPDRRYLLPLYGRHSRVVNFLLEYSFVPDALNQCSVRIPYCSLAISE